MATFRRKHRYLAMVVGVVAVLAVISGIVLVNASGPESAQSLDALTTESTDSTTAATSTTTAVSGGSVHSLLPQTAAEPKVDPKAFENVAANGTAPVILVLDITPTGTEAEKAAQVSERLDQVLGTLPSGSYSDVSRDLTVQTVPVTVNADGLNAMAISPFVNSVKAAREFYPIAQEGVTSIDPMLAPASTNATTVEGAGVAWAAGKKGAGKTVAVVDTGVDVDHPFFDGKTIWEGCFASTVGTYASPCPGGVPMTVSQPVVPGNRGSAAPCPVISLASCAHGTHVAGIAVGGSGTSIISGVAPDASLVAVNVFSYSATLKKTTAKDGDIIKALQWLLNNKSTFTGLSSVNLSVGDGSLNVGACDSDPLAPIIGQLADAHIATVIASGNEGRTNGVSSPACISRAIAVGAIDDATGQSTYFSNDGPQVDVMAPGQAICSSVPTGSTLGSTCSGPTAGTFQSVSGTSMATPAVAGAVAVLAGNGVPYSEWKQRLQRVAQGSSCVQASAYAIPMLRVDVALGLSSQMAAPCAPSSPYATLASGLSATVSWLAPIATGTSALSSYTATSSSGQSCSASVPSTSCTVSGLPIASPVTFTVTAMSMTGTSIASIASNSVTPITVPGAPSSLSVIAGNGRATVSWVDGAENGSGIISYKLYVYADVVLIQTKTDCASSPCTVTGLTNGTAYTFRVSDVNAVGEGALSASSNSVTPAARVPGAPSSLSVIAGNGRATVSWVDGAENGSGIISYKLYVYADVVLIQTKTDCASSPCTVTGLTNGTAYTFRVSDVNAVGEGALSASSNSVTPAMMVPVTPVRLVDTRSPSQGGTTVDNVNLGHGPIGQGQTYEVQIAGRGGLGATGSVAAVAINVTVVSPTASSYLTVYPTGISKPIASNINFVADQTIPNMVITKVGAGGKVTIYNNSGSANVVVDVLAWFPSGPGYTAVSPQRLLDTRTGSQGGGPTIDGLFGTGALGGHETYRLPVVGRGTIPATGVGSVVLNVTVTAPTASNYLTVFPAGETKPNASNLNFVAGQTIANMVISKVGVDGKIAIFNNAGSTQVVVDVVGWFPLASDYTPVVPQRFLDTRSCFGCVTVDGLPEGKGALSPKQKYELQITGRAGVPISGVGSVALNVTVDGSTASNYLSVYPFGAARPTASNLNFVAGQTIANMVIVKLGAGGKITIYNNDGFTPVVVDVVGWFPS